MKFSELKDRAVVDLERASKLGSLDNLIIDPASRQVVGLKIKSGLFNAGKVLPLSDMRSVGHDAITVSQATLPEPDGAVAQEEHPMQKFPDLKTIIGNSVVTQAGKLLGEISDVMLDENTLAITGYEVSSGGIFAKKHSISNSPDLNFGAKILIVPDQIAAELH